MTNITGLTGSIDIEPEIVNRPILNRSTYLLICLIEECAEVIQRVCKAIRFGLDETQPGQRLNNLDRISLEIDDFQGVATMLNEQCDILVWHCDNMAINNKIDKVERYMILSREQGILEKE